jgi:hypothetical protein
VILSLPALNFRFAEFGAYFMARYKYFVGSFMRASAVIDHNSFFDSIAKYLPKTIPDVIYQDRNSKYSFENAPASGLPLWSRSGSLFWSRGGDVHGWSMSGVNHLHRYVLHTFESTLANDISVQKLVKELAVEFDADYTFAHPFPHSTRKQTDRDIQICGAIAKNLPSGLPGVPWISCYGAPYVELFGNDRLLALNLHRQFDRLHETMMLENGAIYSRITTSAAAVSKSENFDLLTQFMMAVLEPTAFFDANRIDGRIIAPSFEGTSSAVPEVRSRIRSSVRNYNQPAAAAHL